MIVLLGLMCLMAAVASAQQLTPEQQYSVPDWAQSAWTKSALSKSLTFESRLNPFCQRGDFDGDGTVDLAVLVRDRATGKSGIAIIHHASGAVFVVGAGRNLGNGGDDWSWMDAWSVVDKSVAGQRASSAAPARKGEALLVLKTEAASALIWWDGTRYRWTQRGD